jgi:hypothetical protein
MPANEKPPAKLVDIYFVQFFAGNLWQNLRVLFVAHFSILLTTPKRNNIIKA